MSLQYQNVLFANVDVDESSELAQTCGIKIIPTFQMFKQAQKVTVFSRFKRIFCCYRSGYMSKPVSDMGSRYSHNCGFYFQRTE
ncbi:PREDICTED: thioredoxin domain-containing protein 8 [Chrysochloris asiatica]|uniref:Thioredoxin domain-containing protein 8 n=1 Tax=Chrysochloris asiatica TaxID=185453 RepID=A0A9B0WP43_CHRAS|nr:PREDICTED: thioredoxin domain-containing protein 8 [Chrysochloris asiatica]